MQANLHLSQVVQELGSCTLYLFRNLKLWQKEKLAQKFKNYIVLTEGRLEEAMKLFHEMPNKNIYPNAVTYNVLIDGFLKEGKWQKATGVLHEMLDKGYIPNDITYNALIDVLGREGKLEEALQLLDALVQIGHWPHEITYNTLINAFSKVGNLHKARELLQEMSQKGCRPDTNFYLIDGLCKHFRIDEC